MMEGLPFLASNSLLNDNSLDLCKAFADNNQYVAIMVNFLSEQIENIVGKGENADNQHFFPFPQCFPKAPVFGPLEAASVSIHQPFSKAFCLFLQDLVDLNVM